jgi:hypothetical protein
MTPEKFCQIGAALRGPNWKTAVAADIERHVREVQYYATGQRPIQRREELKLAHCLRTQAATLIAYANEIEGG